MNLGASGIRNADTKKINFGYAISGKLGLINYGLYKYKDDVKLDLENHFSLRNFDFYDVLFQSKFYEETYDVTVATLGTRFFNFLIF